MLGLGHSNFFVTFEGFSFNETKMMFLFYLYGLSHSVPPRSTRLPEKKDIDELQKLTELKSSSLIFIL
jgi:hypothetical protein